MLMLKELGKRVKMRGLPSILSLFRNEFNKFNNMPTGARIILKIILNSYIDVKIIRFCKKRNFITFPENL